MDPQQRLNRRLNNLLSLGDLYKIADFTKQTLTVSIVPELDNGFCAIINGSKGWGHFAEHALFAAAQNYFEIPPTDRHVEGKPYDYRTEPTAAEQYQHLVDWIVS